MRSADAIHITDLKIDLAQAEITKRYKRLLRRTGVSWVPFGATVTRKVFTTQVTKSIMNCFGVPAVSADMAMSALKSNVWSTLGSNVQLALSEAFHLLGLTATGFTIGSPIWMVTGGLHATYIVPTTCRLFLIMACDLTLVLARSFKEITFRARGQPNEKDVGVAARHYAVRGYARHVHRDIRRLIPRMDLKSVYRIDEVQRGIEDLFDRYRDKLMEGVNLPTELKELSMIDDGRDDMNMETDSVFSMDVIQTRLALKALEAGERTSFVTELDGSQSAVELSGESRACELSADSVPIRAELEDSTMYTKI